MLTGFATCDVLSQEEKAHTVAVTATVIAKQQQLPQTRRQQQGKQQQQQQQVHLPVCQPTL